jgi:hypothetical protein
MALDAKPPAGANQSGANPAGAASAATDPAQTFEYRGASVRRIQRVALSSGPVKYAWRARVDVGNKGQSVTADSVAEIGDKIDAILDAKR